MSISPLGEDGARHFGRRLVTGSLLAAYAAYAFTGAEWLFYVTKPCFMGSYDGVGRTTSLLVPPVVVAALALPAVVALAWAEAMFRPARKWCISVAPAATIAGSLAFLLLDNFTYTLFREGVVTSSGWRSSAYCVVWIALIVAAHRRMARSYQRFVATGLPNSHRAAGVALLALSLGAAGLAFATADDATSEVQVAGAGTKPASLPNVVVISLDGVEAAWLSAYGSDLPTTPFLDEVARESLLFENAFSNCANTTGATTAMLTGRSPEETKVGYPPHVLTRNDAFLHLPGVLRSMGYRAMQSSVRHYADAADLNMQGSFDEANGRHPLAPRPGSFAARAVQGWNAEFLLLRAMFDGVRSRLLHIGSIVPMDNPFVVVNGESSVSMLDYDRRAIERARTFLAETRGPFFLHLHLMTTHPRRDWSRVRAAPTAAVADGRLVQLPPRAQALRDADGLVRALVDELRKRDRLESTLIVVTSDHSGSWTSDQRIPLLIRFPGGERTGHVTRNAQLMDIPATILDAVGATTPDWMKSRSLLSEPDTTKAPQEFRAGGHAPIVSFAKFYGHKVFAEQHGNDGAETLLASLTDPWQPRWGVAEIGVVVCSRFYAVSPRTGRVRTQDIAGHTKPCTAAELPTEAAVRQWVGERLRAHGFRVDYLGFKVDY